jgi:non-heme chloroperoxidase
MTTEPTSTSKFFTTGDGVKLHYVESELSGAKPVLVLLPPWGQTSKCFAHQFNTFHESYRVISLDPRGHGESESPDWGYTVSRFAKDVDDFFKHLGVERLHVLAHSASCAVMWVYIELFGQDCLRSVIFVEKAACSIKQPGFSEEECRNYGVTTTATEVLDLCHRLTTGDGVDETRTYLKSMCSNLSVDALEEIVQENLKMPRAGAAKLLWDLLSSDYRDTLSLISVPALCVFGRDSMIPQECCSYLASQMQHAEDDLVPGGHFMFLEQPEAGFHFVLYEFLKKQHPR